MNKGIKYIIEKLFDDDFLDSSESTEDELNIAENIAPYKFVDLGLPSGTLWCDRNLGAKLPEDYGLYYQWGDIHGYDKNYQDFLLFTLKRYKYADEKYYTKYCTLLRKGNKDNKKILDLEDDPAYVLSEGDCCMPSKGLFNELCQYCYLTLVTVNNINAIKFESAKNNNFIILPLIGLFSYIKFQGKIYKGLLDENSEGHYWTRELETTGLHSIDNAWSLNINNRMNRFVSSARRYDGLPIRAVKYNETDKRK